MTTRSNAPTKAFLRLSSLHACNLFLSASRAKIPLTISSSISGSSGGVVGGFMPIYGFSGMPFGRSFSSGTYPDPEQ